MSGLRYDYYEKYIPLDWETPELLSSVLVNCGREAVSRANYICDGLKRGPRQLAVWQYSLTGYGRIRIGRDWFDVPAGKCFIALVPEDNRYCFPEGGTERWEYIYVTVAGSEAVRLALAARVKFGPVFSLAPESAAVAAAWHMLSLGKRRKLSDGYRNSALAYEFVTTLLSEDVDGSGAESRLLASVRAYCEKHLDRPLSLGEQARVVGYRRWHCSRLFVAAAGKSPHKFLIELKMRYAARLLQTSGDSIKATAAQCGFDDVSYFCKVFREVNGVTPGKFRNSAAAFGTK